MALCPPVTALYPIGWFIQLCFSVQHPTVFLILPPHKESLVVGLGTVRAGLGGEEILDQGKPKPQQGILKVKGLRWLCSFSFVAYKISLSLPSLSLSSSVPCSLYAALLGRCPMALPYPTSLAL